jgi:hypothetical protein
LKITHELDGQSSGFGNNFWACIERQVPLLAERLNASIPLEKVRYTDRYVRSPFTLLLLHSLLGGLTRYSGGLHSSTDVTVLTAKLERLNTDSPRLMYHDWRDGEDRRIVAEDWFKESHPVFSWHEEETRLLPHARELELIWADGEQWSIRLDQGVGYWRIAHHIRPEFPFESETDRQVKAAPENRTPA